MYVWLCLFCLLICINCFRVRMCSAVDLPLLSLTGSSVIITSSLALLSIILSNEFPTLLVTVIPRSFEHFHLIPCLYTREFYLII
jgi:hypothetical protein